MEQSKPTTMDRLQYFPYQAFEKPGINVPIRGFNGHLLRALADSMGFSYEIIESGAWGLEMENGSWSGAMGRIQRNEADMTLCPTNPTAEKMLIGEQTYPSHPIELMLMNGRLSRFDKNLFAIVMTFQGEVWLALVSGLLTIAFLMSLFHLIISDTSAEVSRPPFLSAYGRYIFTLCENTLNEGSANPPPSANSIRILWMSWFLGVTMILMNAFAGQLKASIMFKPEKPRIENLLELHRSGHAVYVAKDSASEQAFKISPVPYIQSIYRRMIRDKTNANAKRILENDILDLTLQDKASIITSRPAEAIAAEQKCKTMSKGEFYVSVNPIMSFNAVSHMNYNLPKDVREQIQKRIHWLADNGILNKWWNEIAGAWSGCSRGNANELDPLNAADFEAIAYISSVGILLSSIVFILEWLTECVRLRIRKKLIDREIKNKLQNPRK